MDCDPRDDFSVFDGKEHMFFRLTKPAWHMRSAVEEALCGQVEGTEVLGIRTFDAPKFLTIGRKLDDGNTVIVSWFGFAVRADLKVSSPNHVEVMPATLTFLYGHVDEPGEEVQTCHFDLHDDAETGFSDEVFKERFLEFRSRADE